MTEAEYGELVLSLPGVEPGTSYGLPSFKLGGRFFTRVRAEDGGAVIQDVPREEREALMEAEPEVWFLTDHYRNYPIVLCRLSAARAEHVRGLLERSWRKRAPKRLPKTLGLASLEVADQRMSLSPPRAR